MKRRYSNKHFISKIYIISINNFTKLLLLTTNQLNIHILVLFFLIQLSQELFFYEIGTSSARSFPRRGLFAEAGCWHAAGPTRL